MKITNKEDFAVIANRPELKNYLENKVKTMSEDKLKEFKVIFNFTMEKFILIFITFTPVFH